MLSRGILAETMQSMKNLLPLAGRFIMVKVKSAISRGILAETTRNRLLLSEAGRFIMIMVKSAI